MLYVCCGCVVEFLATFLACLAARTTSRKLASFVACALGAPPFVGALCCVMLIENAERRAYNGRRLLAVSRRRRRRRRRLVAKRTKAHTFRRSDLLYRPPHARTHFACDVAMFIP